MPIVIVIVAVIAIIVLVKCDVPKSIIIITVPLIFSTLAGLAVAGVVSGFATPFVGVPAGVVVAIFVFRLFMTGKRK